MGIQLLNGAKFQSTVKKIVLCLLSAGMIFTTTGCVSNIMEMNFKSDGSAQIGFVLGNSKQMLTMIEKELQNPPPKRLVDDWPESLVDRALQQRGIPTPKPQGTPEAAPTEKYGDNYRNLIATMNEFIKKAREMTVKEGFLVENYEDAAMTGFLAKKDFKTYQDLKSLGGSTGNTNDAASQLFRKLAGALTIKEEAGKTEISMNVDLTNEMNALQTQMQEFAKTAKIKTEILDTYKLEYRIKVYTKPDSHNASAVEDNGLTLKWDLKKDKKIEMKFTRTASNVQAGAGSGGDEIFLFLLLVMILLIGGVVFFMIMKKKQASNALKNGFGKGSSSGFGPKSANSTSPPAGENDRNTNRWEL